MDEQFAVELTFRNSTKRTYRFEEGGAFKIGTLYVQQSAFKQQPKKIRVTVEVIE